MWRIPERNKDPNNDEWFGLDWGTKYLNGDTVNTSIWILEAGITKITDDNTTTATRVKLRGGIVGGGTIKEGSNNYTYRATNRITTTTSGEQIDRSIDIVIVPQ